MPRKGYCLTFAYDDRGRGSLELHQDSLIVCSADARTGSITDSGNLVHPLPIGRWYVIHPSVDTMEKQMTIGGQGWKTRLYRWNEQTGEYEYTHYLIHPDGNKGGTVGCIGTQGLARNLRQSIDRILRTEIQPCIPAYVNVPRPLDGYDDRQPGVRLATGIQA